jgi:holo-[acyl-carrier protein] synthase
MIVGIGNDIIEISRIEKIISQYGKRFLDRHFTQKEQDYCMQFKTSSRNFSGRFAAKEAIVKALGSGIQVGIGWLDIEIVNNNQGKPEVSFSKRLHALFPQIHVMVSISHSHAYATAMAVAYKMD